MGAAHVFVDDLAAPEVGGEDGHHLQRVLRLRPGEVVMASDGRGGWRSCVYTGSERLDPASDVAYCPAPAPLITIGFALTKGERPEWTVQKLVEAGVNRIVPLTTNRTVVRWEGEKASRQVARLNAVARAAAMQSRQVWLPVVNDLRPFRAIVDQLSAVVPAPGGGAAPGSGGAAGGGTVGFDGAGTLGSGAAGAPGPAGAVALAQMGGAPPDLSRPSVLVGPEGGWDDDELACGLPSVGLGPSVLRAETAALAAGLLLCALRAGTVLPAGGADRGL